MKLGLIVPTPNLGQFDSTGFHLTLAPLYEDERYMRYYKERAETEMVVIDNGAHEGEALPFADLLELAAEVGADEVVIPDVPHAPYATLDLFRGTLSWLGTPAGRLKFDKAKYPRLMFVPQVLREPDRLSEYLDLTSKMIYEASQTRPLEQITIGVALMYDDLEGGLLQVIERLSWICSHSAIQIHLLGWSRKMDSPIKIVRHFPDAVRSIDTCKPFVYARAGEQFEATSSDLADIPPYPGRPDDYFTRPLTSQEAYIGNFNANVCKSLIFDASLPDLPESELDRVMRETHR